MIEAVFFQDEGEEAYLQTYSSNYTLNGCYCCAEPLINMLVQNMLQWTTIQTKPNNGENTARVQDRSGIE